MIGVRGTLGRMFFAVATTNELVLKLRYAAREWHILSTPLATVLALVGEFVRLLQAAAVTLSPMSARCLARRANPQYNHDVLPRILAQSYISCRRIAALGGLRGKNRSVATTVNAYRQNSSFHNYADYAICESFRSGLTELDELGRHQRCAIMCAETLWWRCHRRIIADYLLAAGRTVIHILGRSIPNQRT